MCCGRPFGWWTGSATAMDGCWPDAEGCSGCAWWSWGGSPTGWRSSRRRLGCSGGWTRMTSGCGGTWRGGSVVRAARRAGRIGLVQRMMISAALRAGGPALAQAAFAQGHELDAEEFCRVSERSAAADDLQAQTTWRGVKARLLAQRNQFDSGEALAREAVELAKRTDLVTTQADSLFDLGQVLDSAGRMVDAAAAIREALELYLEKGDVVSADRALSWLTEQGFDSH